ncbi:MAG: hypothetical protein RIQ81_2156 [Pseudomonadota bacterium]
MARFFACILLWGTASIGGGCSKSSFSSTAPVRAPAEPNPGTLSGTQPTPIPTPSQPVPPSCKPGTTITEVKALTRLVDQSQSRRTISYEITLVDCPGTTPSTVADVILFDVDAYTSDTLSAGAPLPHTFAAISDGQRQSGTLRPISGSDLFGNQGNFFHHRSDTPITVTAKTRKAQVDIDFSNAYVEYPREGRLAPVMKVKTYFKFGKAPPVQIDIDFTAQPGLIF